MHNKLIKAIIVSSLLVGASTIVIASEVNCEAAVKNGLSIMKAQMEKNSPGKTNAFTAVMNSPKSIQRGVKKCEEQIKTAKGKAEWACQAKAKSVDGLKACES